MVKWLFKLEIDWDEICRETICIFLSVSLLRVNARKRSIISATWLRWSTLSDFDIDRVLKPSVSLRWRWRSNDIVSEMKRGWEPASREGGQNLDGGHKRGGRWGGRGRLGNRPPLPVSSCQGAHQRPRAFCLSTRLWMKELARAQFQLFIASKPQRWRGREEMRS